MCQNLNVLIVLSNFLQFNCNILLGSCVLLFLVHLFLFLSLRFDFSWIKSFIFCLVVSRFVLFLGSRFSRFETLGFEWTKIEFCIVIGVLYCVKKRDVSFRKKLSDKRQLWDLRKATNYERYELSIFREFLQLIKHE